MNKFRYLRGLVKNPSEKPRIAATASKMAGAGRFTTISRSHSSAKGDCQ